VQNVDAISNEQQTIVLNMILNQLIMDNNVRLLL
jgi:hypothetical protein